MILMRAMKEGDNYEDAEDWEIWLSPILHTNSKTHFVPIFLDGTGN
jgi:hypothetical protein